MTSSAHCAGLQYYTRISKSEAMVLCLIWWIPPSGLGERNLEGKVLLFPVDLQYVPVLTPKLWVDRVRMHIQVGQNTFMGAQS